MTTLFRILAILLFVFVMLGRASALEKRILVINCEEYKYRPTVSSLYDGIFLAVKKELGRNTEVFVEMPDISRLSDPAYEEILMDSIRRKYAGTPLDGVIVVAGPAFRFAATHREELFPGIPVVHAGVPLWEIGEVKEAADVWGVPVDLDPSPLFEKILVFHPRLQRLIVITGTSTSDKEWERNLRKISAKFAGRMEFDFWSGLTLIDIRSRVGKLGADEVIYSPGIEQDGAGDWVFPGNFWHAVTGGAKGPVYTGSRDGAGENGAVGTYMPVYPSQATAAVAVLKRLLAGEKPDGLKLPEKVRNEYFFRRAEMKRWGIPENALPEGSSIIYREKSFYERYRTQVNTVGVIMLAQSGFIVALLVQRRRRRRIEESLRESDELFRQVVDTAPGAMLMVHREGNIVLANAQAEPLFGYPRDAIVGMHLDQLFPLRFRVANVESKGECFGLLPDRVQGADVFCLRADGVEVPVEIDLTPMEIDGDSFTLATIIDITQRKKSEAELELQRRQLTHLTRVSILGEISGSLGHELNQPLSAILCSAQAALKYLEQPSPLPVVKELLEDIIHADRRAGEIISRLRAMLRRDESPVERLDVNFLMTEVLRLIQGELNIRRVSVVQRLSADPIYVTGDGVQLQQVLVNLIINGCDAMAGVPAEGRAIILRTSSDRGGMVGLSVEDHGHGIPPEMEEQVFEPFFTTKSQGLGLGLSICNSIAANHGGSLEIRGKSTSGTIVTLILPQTSLPLHEHAPSYDLSGRR